MTEHQQNFVFATWPFVVAYLALGFYIAKDLGPSYAEASWAFLIWKIPIILFWPIVSVILFFAFAFWDGR